MKPKHLWIKLAAALVLASCVVFLGSPVGLPGEEAGRGPATIALKPPPFVGVASAAGEQASASSIGTFLDSEAGISAYFQADGPINLANVRGLNRTIEVETADYIIGSIPVPNYSAETQDAHVYIHQNGWVLAYYPKGNPTSKMIDLSVYQNNRTITTKLRNVVATVAQAAGSSFSDVTYYHFQYPNATKILVVAEADDGNGKSFNITLPSSFGYYERSWASRTSGGYWSEFKLDGNTLGSGWGCTDCYGTITPDRLLPDVPHTVSLTNHGSLVLVYRVP